MNNYKKILIPGGTGFIGYHLCKFFTKKKWIVHSISKKKPKTKRFVKNVKYILCDVSNNKDLKKKVKQDYDYVINCSGYVDHSKSRLIKKYHFNGSKNLVSIFENKKIKKFIQIGTSVEYGNMKSPQKESFLKKFKNTNSRYGNAKLYTTMFLLNKFKKKNFPVSILRLYLVYGENQESNRVIPYAIKNSLKNNKFNCSSGIQLRDFLYIEDLLSAIYKCLLNPKSNGEVFNIGSGKPEKIKDVIMKIVKLSEGGIPNFSKIKLRKDETLKLYPNIEKAKKVLKWKPNFILSKGLKKTIQTYKN